MTDMWVYFLQCALIGAWLLAPFFVWRYKEDQIRDLKREHAQDIECVKAELHEEFEECEDLELFSRN